MSEQNIKNALCICNQGLEDSLKELEATKKKLAAVMAENERLKQEFKKAIMK